VLLSIVQFDIQLPAKLNASIRKFCNPLDNACRCDKETIPIPFLLKGELYANRLVSFRYYSACRAKQRFQLHADRHDNDSFRQGIQQLLCRVPRRDYSMHTCLLTGVLDMDPNDAILESAPESERWDPVPGSTGLNST
jgi:hypothetical protein